MHEITDHAREIIIMGSLTQIGVLLGSNAMNIPKIATGSMQYPMTLMDWNIDLDRKDRYPLFPNNRQLMLTKKEPIQKIKKIFMKSSYSYF